MTKADIQINWWTHMLDEAMEDKAAQPRIPFIDIAQWEEWDGKPGSPSAPCDFLYKIDPGFLMSFDRFYGFLLNVAKGLNDPKTDVYFDDQYAGANSKRGIDRKMNDPGCEAGEGKGYIVFEAEEVTGPTRTEISPDPAVPAVPDKEGTCELEDPSVVGRIENFLRANGFDIEWKADYRRKRIDLPGNEDPVEDASTETKLVYTDYVTYLQEFDPYDYDEDGYYDEDGEYHRSTRRERWRDPAYDPDFRPVESCCIKLKGKLFVTDPEKARALYFKGKTRVGNTVKRGRI